MQANVAAPGAGKAAPVAEMDIIMYTMDLGTFATSVVSSIGLSAATVAWLSGRLVDHRLKKDMGQHTHKLNTELERHKNELGKARDEWQTGLRRQVEEVLGNAAADRDYTLSARKRLYQVIGPLRFQLLLACGELTRRICGHGSNPAPYRTSITGYYGISTLYRILRPVAISELIERQIAFADFSVDRAAVEVLRFRRALFAALTDGRVILDHPDANWDRQEQHVFSDNLRKAGNAIIKRDGDIERVLYFHEFNAFVGAVPASARRILVRFKAALMDTTHCGGPYLQ